MYFLVRFTTGWKADQTLLSKGRGRYPVALTYLLRVIVASAAPRAGDSDRSYPDSRPKKNSCEEIGGRRRVIPYL